VADVFVGNVGSRCTESLIRSMFEVYGQVEDVSVSCNCAIIHMRSDSEADDAIRDLSDQALYQTPIVSSGGRELMWARFISR
jgi:RNA recognition motif